jgi:tetratricopeptide (TPR) repeat protein
MLRGDPDYRDETYYYLGRIAELESDYLQATRSYTRVTEGIRAVEAQIRAASIMFQHMGGAESALRHLEDFGSASPRFAPEMLLARAQLLLRMGRAAEGMRVIDAAVVEQGAVVDASLRRTHVDFYVALMQDAIDRGDLLAAQNWIDEGLGQYPENHNLRYAQSRLLQQQGELRRAQRSLEDLVEEAPGDPTFLNALGYLMTDSLDRHKDARGYIQRALALDPENGAILDSMGWVLYHLDDLDLALEYLERAYRAFPATEVLAHLADVHWALGDRERARQMIEDGLDETPGDPFLTEIRNRLLQ